MSAAYHGPFEFLLFFVSVAGVVGFLTSAPTELAAIILLRRHGLERGLSGGALACWILQVPTGALGWALASFGLVPSGILLAIAGFAAFLTYVLTLTALVSARASLANRIASRGLAPPSRPIALPSHGEGPDRRLRPDHESHRTGEPTPAENRSDPGAKPDS